MEVYTPYCLYDKMTLDTDTTVNTRPTMNMIPQHIFPNGDLALLMFPAPATAVPADQSDQVTKMTRSAGKPAILTWPKFWSCSMYV